MDVYVLRTVRYVEMGRVREINVHKCDTLREICENVLHVFRNSFKECSIVVTVLSSLPSSDSLNVFHGYWSFMLPCLHFMHGLLVTAKIITKILY